MRFHEHSFKFEWPALQLTDHPKVIWHKLGNGFMQCELIGGPRVEIVSSEIQLEGFEDVKSDENAGSVSKTDSQASQ